MAIPRPKTKLRPRKITNLPSKLEKCPDGLQKKIHQIIERIHVDKNGWNDFSGYPFLQVDDIIASLKVLLAELRLVVRAKTGEIITEDINTQDGRRSTRVTVHMIYTLADIDSSDSEDYPVVGQGVDTGDKALYKAYSGAYKYWAIQNFQIDGDSMDPENSGRDDQQKKQSYADRELILKKEIKNEVHEAGWKKGSKEAKEQMEGAYFRLCDKFKVKDLSNVAVPEMDQFISAIREKGFISSPGKTAAVNDNKEQYTLTGDQQLSFQRFYRKELDQAFHSLPTTERHAKAIDLVAFVMEQMNISQISEIQQAEISTAENYVFMWIRDNK